MATACVALGIAGDRGALRGTNSTRSRNKLTDDVVSVVSSIEGNANSPWRRHHHSLARTVRSRSSERLATHPESQAVALAISDYLQSTNKTAKAYLKAQILVQEILSSLPRLLTPLHYGSFEAQAGCGSLTSEGYVKSESFSHSNIAASVPTRPNEGRWSEKPLHPLLNPALDFSIDLDVTASVREHKGGKKNTKKNQQNNWQDSDNEGGGNNGEAGNNEEAGGGAGGGIGGGAGGDEGGDDWEGYNGWNKGGKKSKTKKKKAKQDEEDQAKEEEEKLKEEEQSKLDTNISSSNPLSWADNANDANGDEEWAFTTAKESKKKGKKGKDEEKPITSKGPLSTFDEINLDSGTPQIQMDFDGPVTSGAGGGGSGWAPSWGFGSSALTDGANKAGPPGLADKDPLVSNANPSFGAANPWSTGNKSKNKKGAPMSSGFDFGDFGASQNLSMAAADINADTRAPAAGESGWGSAAVNVKDSKKKKGLGAAEDKLPTFVSPPMMEHDATAADAWDLGFSAKNDSKKGKKGSTPEEFDLTGQDGATTAPGEEVDDWPAFGYPKKGNKKGNKGIIEQAQPDKKQVDLSTESTNALENNLSSTKKKDKKKKKGPISEVVDDRNLVSEDGTTAAVVGVDENGWPNSSFPTEGQRSDDQHVAGLAQEGFDLMSANTGDANLATAEDTWPSSTKKSKKDKKGKKGATQTENTWTISEPNVGNDAWLAAGKNDETKNSKSKDVVPDPLDLGIGNDYPLMEGTTEDAFPDRNLTATERKKKEKEAKKKTDKNSKDEAPPPVPSPPPQGLTPEPSPGKLRGFGDDDWAELDSTKPKQTSKGGVLSSSTIAKSGKSKISDSKSKVKAAKEDKTVTIAAPDGLEPLSPTDKGTKEDTPAKTVKGFWGGFSSTATTTKSKKEKEKAQKEEAEAASNEMATDPVKEAGKEDELLIDMPNEPKGKKESLSSKAKTSETKIAGSKKDKASDKKAGKKSDDYFSFTSSSKKPAGKKDTEAEKEINGLGWANESEALDAVTNDLGGGAADEADPTSEFFKNTSTTTKKNKATASSSVAAKIKAFEGNKRDSKTVKSKDDASNLAKDLVAPEALVQDELPKEEKKPGTPKAKSLSASASKPSKKKQTSPTGEEKQSKDTVPGSFPGELGDDDEDLMALDDVPAAKEKKPGKKIKEDKKGSSKTKAVKLEPDLLVDGPDTTKLPTPPPDDKKSTKKERARVERTGAASSWGLWGAATPAKKETPKKEASKPSNGEEPLSTRRRSTPAHGRSKSARHVEGGGAEDGREGEKISRSSDSDNKGTPTTARPTKPNRGMSFSAFMMGGPPPSASKNKPSRRSSVAGVSRSNSRRGSVDIGEGSGLLSPPPDDQAPIADKAARMMGVKSTKIGRSKSTKGKGKVAGKDAPDPYPIDDDDMVLVNDTALPSNGASVKSPQATKSASRGKSKRESKTNKPRARTLSNEDDVVMVDAATAGGEQAGDIDPDEPDITDQNPPELKRSNTASKKVGGFFGSFFGGGGGSAGINKAEKSADGAARARPPSSYRDEKINEAENFSQKNNDRSKRRSMKAAPGDVEAVEPGLPDSEAEARRSQRRSAREVEDAERTQRRRARREKEKAELEDRRTKARARTRKQQEAEEQRREEKRAKRAAKEELRLQEEAEISAAARAKKEERRKSRTAVKDSEAGKAKMPTVGGDLDDEMARLQRSKEDRKRQFEQEEQERLRRRDEKTDKPRGKDKSSKPKSATSPLMDEYFGSRNGNAAAKSSGGPGDKTSSWVKSQASDPPDLPPVEGTILDGEKPRSGVAFHEDVRSPDGEGHKKRSSKHDSRRRQSKHGRGEADVDERRAARRRDSKRAGAARALEGDEEPSDEPIIDIRSNKHRQSRRKDLAEEYDAYADGGSPSPVSPVRSPESRPQNTKRNSIFGRLGGLL